MFPCTLVPVGIYTLGGRQELDSGRLRWRVPGLVEDSSNALEDPSNALGLAKTRPMRWGSRGAGVCEGLARRRLCWRLAGSRRPVQCARPRRCCAREPYGTAFLSRLQASPACPQGWACTGISFERCGGAVAVLLPRRSHHRPVRCRCRSPMTMITTNMITTNSSLPSS